MFSKKAQTKKKAKSTERECAYSGCSEMFAPRNRQHKTHHWQCAMEYTKEVKAERAAKEKRAALKEFNQNDKSYMMNKAQKTMNKYARLRDYGKPCISCGCSYFKRQIHGGHFRPSGNNHAITFNLWNIHAQCAMCNKDKSGNLTDYEPNLIAKIGQERVTWLKAQTQPKKYDIEYLQRLDRVFMKKIRMIEKRKNIGRSAA